MAAVRERLELRQVEQVAVHSRNLLRASGKDSLHVDWYGGEPLMNVEFLEEALLPLQAVCAEMGITYSASVISNGTCWPRDVEGFLWRTDAFFGALDEEREPLFNFVGGN